MRKVCLVFDDDLILTLDKFKHESKKSKSEIVRKVMHYFFENKEELKEKIIENKNEK